ncbi:MAG TPA: PIN domain-containing protein, partial [bacterium]|nr:PIN domain-containing protein [bacterium]
PKDHFHHRAVQLAEQMQKKRIRLVTTRAIIVELGNALSKIRYRKESIRLIRALESDPMIEIIPLSEPIFTKAFQLYASRPDKEWGITDCISFVVMQEREILEALTTDDHFLQAGFQISLKPI